ncbi:MAG: TonB-dependent receptor [bacterium]|nr:TonB-dependent receptor [bacterium]
MVRTLFVVLALALACGSAVADENDAKTLFTRGRTAYALGRFSEAAELFEKAFELKQDPAILYNAAQAHRLAGDKKKALVLYQNYLRLFGEQENAGEVERRIVDLKAAIEAEQAAKTNPPTGLLNDKGEPPASTTAPPAAPVPPPPLVLTQSEQPAKKPLARRGWIWGVVVGSVAVAGGAVALGVVLGTAKSGPDITLGSVKGN